MATSQAIVTRQTYPLRFHNEDMDYFLSGLQPFPVPMFTSLSGGALAGSTRDYPQFLLPGTLLPRDSGTREVRWSDAGPCWVVHTLNAYDDTRPAVAVNPPGCWAQEYRHGRADHKG